MINNITLRKLKRLVKQQLLVAKFSKTDPKNVPMKANKKVRLSYKT